MSDQLSVESVGSASAIPPWPVTPSKQFPGFLQALFLLFLIHLIANVVGGVLILPGMIADYLAHGSFTQTMALAAVGIVANSIAFGLITWFTWRRSKLPARQAFPLHGVPVMAALTMLLLFGGTLVLAELVSTGLFRLLPPPDFIVQIFKQLLGSEAPLVLSAIFLVVIAPVTEEFFFRGVLQRSLSIRYGPNKAILYSGLLFGIMHVLPWQVVPAVILGTLFAFWRERTGSLWPPLIAHAITNGTSFVMSRLHPEYDPLVPDWPEPLFLAGGAVMLLAGLVLAKRYLPSAAPSSIAERSSL
ncbi:MAG: type II CAAX endopeptidase family protein [Candidatus Eisenbacteria bacterium]|nr:type II CAAX endopeptidase family protein [Candidatus Eisenbacteria bacterium]